MPLRHLHSLASICFLLVLVTTANASPTYLAKRDPVITYDSSGQITNVTDASTGQEIAQGSATDGAGEGMNAPAIVWLAWSFAVGVPLMLGGIRLSRLTTGAAIGCAGTLCIWASFANALNANGISDVLLMILSMGAFAVGFTLGLFNFGRIAGIAGLAALGGLSIGVRVILFRPGLLIPHPFWANWLVIAAMGAATFVLSIVRQRAAITICSAAVGTFLTALGVDLLVNKQLGMSLGLRHLFDNNSAHVQYLKEHKYSPPLVTEIVMGVSLALIPLLAYAQHLIFKQPFKRVRQWSISSRASLEDDTTIANRASETGPETEKAPLKISEETSIMTPIATPSATVCDLNSPREDTPFKRAQEKSVT